MLLLRRLEHCVGGVLQGEYWVSGKAGLLLSAAPLPGQPTEPGGSASLSRLQSQGNEFASGNPGLVYLGESEESREAFLKRLSSIRREKETGPLNSENFDSFHLIWTE